MVIDGSTLQHLAGVSIHPAANYTEIRAIVDAVMRERGIHYSIGKIDDPAFLNGRRAAVLVDNKEVGMLGEIHPNVITSFGMQQPAVGFELVV